MTRVPGELSGRRVTVMGLGRFGGGVGVTRWLAAQGARLTVTDREPAERLGPSLEQIAGCGAELRLGGHDERDFREADLVVANPAVPDTSPFLAAARAAGVPVTTEINLFVERCAARVVGVTGSVGKSTVTAMTGHVLERVYSAGRTLIGGNLGGSLLDALPQITAQDLVVLELSSFQLQRTPAVRWSPHVALITNLAPNHLDWHGTFNAYAAAKLNIVRFQDPERDRIIIGEDAALLATFDEMFGDHAGVWRYGLDGNAARARCQSTSAAEFDDRVLRWDLPALAAPGRHNRLNAGGALTVAAVLGLDTEQASAALATFAGLPHRLRMVCRRDGVTYVDDSKSTTPEAALTALASFDVPLLLILGGYDKGSDLGELAQAAARRARYVACIGVTGPRIAAGVRAAGGEAGVHESLEAAVAECRGRARDGDVVLLSPGCASWDMFEDYRARGAAFARSAQA